MAFNLKEKQLTFYATAMIITLLLLSLV
jgi:hypothetical protein